MIVKICGITNLQDAKAALDAGADWIGLNLVAGPRRIPVKQAVEILCGIDDPSRSVGLIGVDPMDSARAVIKQVRTHGMKRFQLYGDPHTKLVDELRAAGSESILVLHVTEETTIEDLDARIETCEHILPDFVLFDTAAGGKLGGTGRRLESNVLENIGSSRQRKTWPAVLLAGGLTSQNVADAIRKTSPAGVDVSSGVESAPGRKDQAKMIEFVKRVRAAKIDCSDHP